MYLRLDTWQICEFWIVWIDQEFYDPQIVHKSQ